MRGLIPLMLAIVQPIAPLCFLKTLNNSSSLFGTNEKLIPTGDVLFFPKNAYLSVDGNDFNSKIGGCTMDGKIFFSCGGNFSNVRV